MDDEPGIDSHMINDAIIDKLSVTVENGGILALAESDLIDGSSRDAINDICRIWADEMDFFNPETSMRPALVRIVS